MTVIIKLLVCNYNKVNNYNMSRKKIEKAKKHLKSALQILGDIERSIGMSYSKNQFVWFYSFMKANKGTKYTASDIRGKCFVNANKHRKWLEQAIKYCNDNWLDILITKWELNTKYYQAV